MNVLQKIKKKINNRNISNQEKKKIKFTGKRRKSSPLLNPTVEIPETPMSPPTAYNFSIPRSPPSALPTMANYEIQKERLDKLNDKLQNILENTQYDENELKQNMEMRDNEQNSIKTLSKEIKEINKNIHKLEKTMQRKEEKIENINNEMKNTMLLFQKLDNVTLKVQKSVLKNKINSCERNIHKHTENIEDIHKNINTYQNINQSKIQKLDQTSENADKIQEKINELLLAVQYQSKFLEDIRDNNPINHRGGNKKQKTKKIKSVEDITKQFKEKTRYIKVLEALKKLKRSALDKIAKILTLNPRNYVKKSHIIAIISLLIHARYGVHVGLEDYIIIAANLGILYSDFIKNRSHSFKQNNAEFIITMKQIIRDIPFDQVIKHFSNKLFPIHKN